MYTRHLSELIGEEDPESGLMVCAYKKGFDFEYQVEKHLAMAKRTKPGADEEDEAHDIRRLLAVGQAWLHYDPRFDRVTNTDCCTPAVSRQWVQASLFSESVL